MIEIYAIIASALIAGAFIGILAMLAIGIHREEKAYSLTVDSPSRITSSARAANGVYAKAPGVARQTDISRPDRLVLAGPGPGI